jgi:hypothetical protein
MLASGTFNYRLRAKWYAEVRPSVIDRERNSKVTDDSAKTTVLLLGSDAGELYAIPQEDLEKYRVTDEQRAEVEQQWGELGDDVSGYSMELYQAYLIHKAESNLSAEEMRRKADYSGTGDDVEETETSAGTAAEPQGLRRAFTGLLMTLRLAPAKVPEEG